MKPVNHSQKGAIFLGGKGVCRSLTDELSSVALSKPFALEVTFLSEVFKAIR